MLFLFQSKSEKILAKALKSHPELELRYKDGSNVTVSKLLKVSKDYITILGFGGKLRFDQLQVKILGTRQIFNTKVIKTGRDNSGQNVFICEIPKKIVANKGEQDIRYIIYPNGSVNCLISTNQGQRGLNMPIWDFGPLGLSMVNKTDIEFKTGTRIFQAIVKIQDLDTQLIDMQVVSQKPHEEDNQKFKLLDCNFRSFPKRLNELVAASKKNQRHLKSNFD